MYGIVCYGMAKGEGREKAKRWEHPMGIPRQPNGGLLLDITLDLVQSNR